MTGTKCVQQMAINTGCANAGSVTSGCGWWEKQARGLSCLLSAHFELYRPATNVRRLDRVVHGEWSKGVRCRRWRWNLALCKTRYELCGRHYCRLHHLNVANFWGCWATPWIHLEEDGEVAAVGCFSAREAQPCGKPGLFKKVAL
jgi:hypothetical protein